MAGRGARGLDAWQHQSSLKHLGSLLLSSTGHWFWLPSNFSKLTLGTVTPHFTGMLLQNSGFFSFFFQNYQWHSFLIQLWCLLISNIGKCLILQEHILEIVHECYGYGLLQWIEIYVKQNIILGISMDQAILVIHMLL